MRTLTIGATAACVLAASVMLSARQSDRETALHQSTPVVPSPMAWGLNGYSLVLVVGDMQPGGTASAVPSAARKALIDVQSFLPYKRYQLLDAEWMLCCTGFGNTVSGRVHGPDGRDYEYSIVTDPGDHARFSLRFSMRDLSVTRGGGGFSGTRGGEISDTARAEYSRQLYEATKERDEAELAYTRIKKQADVGMAQQSDVTALTNRIQLAITRIKELQLVMGQGGRGGAAGANGPNIMDNTFFISLGETVVIGTSRLKGDQALIALLTAVPKSGRKD